jgi:hypothetical protein
MERTLPKISLLFSFLCTSFISIAQDITGIWRGYFITETTGDQYKLEFQIKQDNTAIVNGVSYSYLDVRFYGKATMTGNFSFAKNNMIIQEIRTVELKMSGGSVACIMKYNLEYTKSGNEEFLEGSFTSKYEKGQLPYIKKGGDCGGGTVYLRKVTTSDFYVESFLRDKPNLRIPSATKKGSVKKIIDIPVAKRNTFKKKNPSVTKITKPKPKINPPITKIDKPKTKINNPVTKITKPKQKVDSAINKTSTSKTSIDTSKRIITQPIIKSVVTEKKPITIPAVLRERENALTQTITVSTNEVLIKIYDNGEIDDDTVSVYVDKQLVLANKRISEVPLILKLQMDENNAEHEVIMVAENLGRIPPNTSLMIIYAGDKRYQVQITSTEQKNALVRFKYVKPSP